MKLLQTKPLLYGQAIEFSESVMEYLANIFLMNNWDLFFLFHYSEQVWRSVKQCTV